MAHIRARAEPERLRRAHDTLPSNGDGFENGLWG
jgi:hypothetical protein